MSKDAPTKLISLNTELALKAIARHRAAQGMPSAVFLKLEVIAKAFEGKTFEYETDTMNIQITYNVKAQGKTGRTKADHVKIAETIIRQDKVSQTDIRARVMIEEDNLRIHGLPATTIDKYREMLGNDELKLSHIIKIKDMPDYKITAVDQIGELTYFNWSYDDRPAERPWADIWNDLRALEAELGMAA